MYRYERTSDNTYIKEGGLHSTSRRTHLGDGWYHAWGSFTTTSTTARLYAYSFLYNYGLQTDRFSVAKISLVKNSTGNTHYIIPPHLLQEPSTTISSTQSLIDLKGTNNVDTSNVSFNSSAQITFDGTDDKITQPYDMSDMTKFSIEFWAKTYNTGSNSGDANTALAGPNGGGTYIRTGFSKTNSRLSILFYVDGAENQKSMSTNINYSDFNPLGYNHYAFTIENNDSMNIYFNGERKNTETAGMSNLMTTGLDNYYQRIGNYAGSYLWEGEIPICRLYDTKLSDKQILQSYNASKKRFGI